MYDFATNPLKLQRAIVIAGPDGDVKAEYIKLGGLLASGHEPTTVQVVVEEEVTIGETVPDFAESIDEKPKKAKKK